MADVPLHVVNADPAFTVGGEDQLTTRVETTALFPAHVPDPKAVNVAVKEPAADDDGVNVHCAGSVKLVFDQVPSPPPPDHATEPTVPLTAAPVIG